MGRTMTVIIGIDPGSQVAGVGVLKVNGDEYQALAMDVIQVPKKFSFAEKLHYIRGEMQKIISEFSPHEMVVEKAFLGKNVDSAFKLGHVRGVLLQLAIENNMSVFEYAPKSVKKKVTGNGGASKEQVQQLVCHRLGIRAHAMFDATDAMSMALAHAQEREVQAMLKKQMGQTTL